MGLARYAWREGSTSLWRGRRAAIVAMAAITAVVFVAGAFLVVSLNARRIVRGWSASAEMSIYLADDAPAGAVQELGQWIENSGMAHTVEYVSRDDAFGRFRRDFPGLAGIAGESASDHPLPASFEVQLRPEAASGAVFDAWVGDVRARRGVIDVRYDLEWLSRLQRLVRTIEVTGFAIVAILGFAAALTVASVVRLAAASRADEIDIMRLVGAPLSTIRAPFMVEGLLQGALGALLALALLAAGAWAVQARYGQWISDVTGLNHVSFLPPAAAAAVIGAGVVLGGIGGFVASRGAARP
ncbi:MAG: permease-like cell division protein FtsX [Acidobacteriota bacterium]|nr:permease-like cell division protein FtsX [Acidobacteriota bacterium]